MNEKPVITPKTKVLHLLEAYPFLEEILIAIVPAFQKLKNPLLRKTVAKIATLQQAAAIGNIQVEDLINRLRGEVGQELFSGNDGKQYQLEKPDWFAEHLLVKELDAGPMLAAGEQPVNQVLADLQTMAGGSIYKLRAPFLPAPLLDKASSLQIEHWLIKESDESFVVYFHKSATGLQDNSRSGGK